MVFSAAILLCPVFSPAFWIFYIAAGLSDMLDGALARKFNAVSHSGEKLDTAADVVFVAVCLIKLLPAVALPLWNSQARPMKWISPMPLMIQY